MYDFLFDDTSNKINAFQDLLRHSLHTKNFNFRLLSRGEKRKASAHHQPQNGLRQITNCSNVFIYLLVCENAIQSRRAKRGVLNNFWVRKRRQSCYPSGLNRRPGTASYYSYITNNTAV